jgi:hypothetical protein
VSLNSGNQKVEGTIINGKDIGKKEDFNEGHSFSGGVGFGNGSVGVSLGFDDFSFGVGGGQQQYLSLGYGDFSLGASHNNLNSANTLFGSAFGVGASLSASDAISKDHTIFSPTLSYGPFAVSGNFQHGELKNVSGVAGLMEFSTQIAPWDLTCFVAGTPIKMADGSIKVIESVKAGDKVLSWNESTGKNELRTVLNAFRKETKLIVELKLSNGKLIETTPDHPFYVSKRGWVEAGKLNLNDKLLDEAHSEVQIQSINIVGKQVPVYNLEIEGNHTYYAHGVLVHNVNCFVNTTPDGGKVISDHSGKILAEIDPKGTIKVIDGQALKSTISEDAKATLGFNPVLNFDPGKETNVVYDPLTGSLREIVGYRGFDYISGGSGYSAGTLIKGENIGPIFGETLGVWPNQLGYNLLKAETVLGSIITDALVGGGIGGTGGVVIGGIAGGATAGGSLNLIDQVERIDQSGLWNGNQAINWGNVGKDALIYGAVGGVVSGVSVGSSLIKEFDGALNSGVRELENFNPKFGVDGVETRIISYPRIQTPHTTAEQSLTLEALSVRQSVEEGAYLYRSGTYGVSNEPNAQYWSTIKPSLDENYAKQFGLPMETSVPDYIIIGKLKLGSPFITREAPGIGLNKGGNIEVVTPKGSVELFGFHPKN